MKQSVMNKIEDKLGRACVNDDLVTGWWGDFTLAEKKKTCKFMGREDFVLYDHGCKKHKRGWYSIKKRSLNKLWEK